MWDPQNVVLLDASATPNGPFVLQSTPMTDPSFSSFSILNKIKKI